MTKTPAPTSNNQTRQTAASSLYTHIAFLIDRSGSMAGMSKAVEEAFSAFVQEQQATEGRTTLSLYTFDNVVEEDLNFVDVQVVSTMTHIPRGGTALYDAVSHVIGRTRAQIAEMEEWDRPDVVFLVINTDGQENCSREVLLTDVKAFIAARREEGWKILFQGATEDAFAQSTHLGIDPGLALRNVKTSGGYASTMASTSDLVSRTRKMAAEAKQSWAGTFDAAQINSSYTEKERNEAMDKKDSK